jgi:hypothetical protein
MIPGDGEAVRTLINRVFGANDPAFVPYDDAWRAWKYERNPAGAHGLIAENPQGEIVGFYGGVPIRMAIRGASYLFGQNVDSCTDASERRGLKNPGTFVRVAQAYASTFARKDGDAVMYGMATKAHYRLGVRYLDYWMLRTQPMLVLRDPSRLPGWDWATHAVPTERFPAAADRFATEALADYPCVAVRDAAFLNWRFCERPGGAYRAAYAKSGDRDDYRGHAVFVEARFGERETALLADWFVRPGDEGAARSLLRFVAERAAQAGKEELVFVCPPSSPWFARFQEWGFAAEPSPYVMIARPYDPRLTSADLRADWYYTLADLDIV